MSVVEVYGVDAIERMLEDLIVASEQSATVKLPDPNSNVLPSSIPESEIREQKIDGEVQTAVHTSSQGIEGIDEPQKPNLHLKSPGTSNIPDPVMEIRQQPNGRIHGDAALKILMQKVRSLEINLSVLEEYIKELNRRQGDVVPELEKELSRYSMLLEKSRSDINELLEWKKIMDKGVTEFEVWKAIVSSRMDEVVRENGMLSFWVITVRSFMKQPDAICFLHHRIRCRKCRKRPGKSGKERDCCSGSELLLRISCNSQVSFKASIDVL
ncbi:hypothetical protein RHMOL_Rhmol04G0341200 [Rhododendron molle]|uniref:Uncharacterized protein n=1 Tax=Rhododendron molle TaxID=49168 RepID=A0ACC0P8I2_RHOML|nr:hypothetical protein RHMOL_Rhmol04G0341200 [Rhododendron molle]